MPAGVLIADAASGAIVLANEQAKELLGRSLTSANVGDYDFQGFDRNGIRFEKETWPLSRALHEGVAVSGEEVVLVTDGGKRSVMRADTVPLRSRTGKIVGAICMFQDITERKKTEEMAAQQARFREEFIGIVGHDLRSPLSAISVSGQVLLRQRLDASQTRAVRRILSSADRMKRMINDLLDLTRSRLGGGIPISRRPTELRDVCRQVIEEHELIHRGRKIHFDATGSSRGEWDPDRIAEVLSNLLGNALKYGTQAAPVRVILKDSSDGREIILAVHNEGPPIPELMIPVLFDPFRRGVAPEDTATNSPGLGLGLYITHQIVRAHGGTIEVISSEETGTTFSVTLPSHFG
jgi:PAS domain S-box-containing protein